MNYKKIYKLLEQMRLSLPADLSPPPMEEFNEAPIYEWNEDSIPSGGNNYEYFADGIHLPNPITRFFCHEFEPLFVGCFWEIAKGEFNFAMCNNVNRKTVFAQVRETFPAPTVYFFRSPKANQEEADQVAFVLSALMSSYVIRDQGPVVEKIDNASRSVSWYKNAQWITTIRDLKSEGGTKRPLRGCIFKEGKTLFRASSWVNGHQMKLRASRYKKEKTWRKGHYRGPKEFQHNGQIYRHVK